MLSEKESLALYSNAGFFFWGGIENLFQEEQPAALKDVDNDWISALWKMM